MGLPKGAILNLQNGYVIKRNPTKINRATTCIAPPTSSIYLCRVAINTGYMSTSSQSTFWQTSTNPFLEHKYLYFR